MFKNIRDKFYKNFKANFSFDCDYTQSQYNSCKYSPVIPVNRVFSDSSSIGLCSLILVVLKLFKAICSWIYTNIFKGISRQISNFLKTTYVILKCRIESINEFMALVSARLCNNVYASDRGSATAEYAVIALCAVAFAGILLGIIKGGLVENLLSAIINKALQIL